MFVEGATGGRVPVYFLDTDLPENEPQDRSITHRLYQGDHVQQLKQRAVLGIAGPRLLRALTHDVDVFHMNEGHGFLLTLELMSEHLSRYNKFDIDDASIAAAFAFLAALGALVLMMRLLRSISFTPYVVYRVILGIGLLIWAYS